MVFHCRNVGHPVRQFRDEMDRLVSGLFGRTFSGLWPDAGRGQPAVNIWEENDVLFVELEVPGVKREEVDISVAGGELSLKVERPEVEQEGAVYHRRERRAGSFRRVLRLPFDIDSDRVEAELRDGLLTISLPKADNAKPRKIPVTSGS